MATINLTPLHMEAFERLKGIAERNERCPSNRELGLWANASPGWGQSLIEMLQREGYIRVFARKVQRRIKIVETGKWTLANVGDTHAVLPEIIYKQVNNYGAYPVTRYDPADPSTVPAGAVLVDRDPCPFCAVRGDIGCEHSRRRAA